MRRDMAVNMTDEKALQWYVPPGCVKLYQLLRAQGNTPDAAVRNVFAAMQIIVTQGDSTMTTIAVSKKGNRVTILPPKGGSLQRGLL